MTKKYIRDNGKVRMCDSNVAKMNILECMYYSQGLMKDNIISTIIEFLNSWHILVNVLIIPILPFIYPIMAWQYITKAKQEILRNQND